MTDRKFADVLEEIRLMRYDFEMPSDFEDKLMDLTYELNEIYVKDCNYASAEGYKAGMDDSRAEWF